MGLHPGFGRTNGSEVVAGRSNIPYISTPLKTSTVDPLISTPWDRGLFVCAKCSYIFNGGQIPTLIMIPMNLICHENGVRRIRGFVYGRFRYEKVYCTSLPSVTGRFPGPTLYHLSFNHVSITSCIKPCFHK